MSEYLSSSNPGPKPQFLPEHLSSPEKKAEFEKQMLQNQQQNQNQSPQNNVQALTKSLVNPGEQKVYVENNRARSFHFRDSDGNPLVIDGQLSATEAGPFLIMTEDVLSDLFSIHSYFNKKIGGTGKPVLSKLTEQEFRQHWTEYQKRARVLMAEWAKTGSNSSRHEDGTIDEQDQAWDSFKINYELKR